MKVGIVDDPRCELHVQTSEHPESPYRIREIRKKLKELSLYDKLVNIPAVEITLPQLLRVHTKEYIDKVYKICLTQQHGVLGEDLQVNGENSFMSAIVASGGVLQAVKAIEANLCQHVFCNVRPPGHHATASQGRGFCIFNNVALGVQQAKEIKGVNKILIFDFDVHHGDGTADIFKYDDSVLTVSIHRSPPFYPGTGSITENRETTLNYPMPAYSGSAEYREVMLKDAMPAVQKFNPDFIFISCGIDAHKDDPTGANIRLETHDYGWMTHQLKLLGKPIVAVLEGGYNLRAVADSCCSVVSELLRETS